MLNPIMNSATDSAVPHRVLRLQEVPAAERIVGAPAHEDAHRPMKGILLAVLLGTAIWAMVICALIVW